MTNGEDLEIALTNADSYLAADFMNHCVTTVKGNDYVVDFYSDTKRENALGKIIIKGFVKKSDVIDLKIGLYAEKYQKNNADASIDLIKSTLKIGILDPVPVQLVEYYKGTNWDGEKSTINGTRLSERFDASAYKSTNNKGMQETIWSMKTYFDKMDLKII